MVVLLVLVKMCFHKSFIISGIVLHFLHRSLKLSMVHEITKVTKKLVVLHGYIDYCKGVRELNFFFNVYFTTNHLLDCKHVYIHYTYFTPFFLVHSTSFIESTSFTE